MILLASLRKELLELGRTHRLLILGVVLILFGLASPLLAKLTPELMRLLPGGEDLLPLIPEPTLLDAITQYVKNMGQFGLLLAVLLTMGAVAQEKERGTAVLVLVKPLPRSTFLLAKFLALALAFLLFLALAGLGGYYYTALLFATPNPWGWLLLNLLLWLYALVYVALTLLASTLVESQAAAAGLGFATALALAGLSALPKLGDYLPGRLLDWGAALAASSSTAATPSSAESWPALWISLVLILCCLLGAWLLFRRQEL
jgi:ABC-2 type transport system permease protein